MSQARRTLKAAAGAKKAPAVRPGGLRELVAGHLREHPGENFTPPPDGWEAAQATGSGRPRCDAQARPEGVRLASW
jgi:hypothetical protein